MATLPFLAAALGGGCAQSADSSGSSSSGKTVIDYWNGFTGPDGTTMTAMVEDFERANPDVEVRQQIIPWATYYDKLTLSLAYGGAPDVFILESARFPEFAHYGTLKPIAGQFQSSSPPLTEKDFTPLGWRSSFYNGVQYAMPLGTFPIGLFYNTKLFKDAGIVDADGNAKPPTDLTDFLADAKKLTKDTNGDGEPDQWGFAITNQHTNWLTFAHEFGGDILTPDGKKAEMSSPQCLAATHLLCDLIYKYKVAPKPEGTDPYLAFRQGKVAMIMEGIYMVHQFQEDKMPFSGAPAPQFGPIKGVWGGSHILCEPATISPAKASAAWRLMRYLSDHSLEWAAGGQTPARVAILNSAGFKALTVQSNFAKQLGYVVYDPQYPKAYALGQFVDPAIGDSLIQVQSPEDEMRDADRRIDQLLSRP